MKKLLFFLIFNFLFADIKILEQKTLNFPPINSIKVNELSDIAYNPKTKRLYFIGDEGYLFEFEAIFSKNKIEKLTPIDAFKLKNRKGKRFKRSKRDSEGLAINNKGELFISFEGEKTKIGKFLKNGRMIKKYRLPKPLRKSKNYRSSNKSLEALAWHPYYGLLFSTEYPLKNSPKQNQTIYTLYGKKWHFKTENKNSAITALEVIDKENILILERSYNGLLEPLIITLKQLNLKTSKTEILLKMDSSKGWNIDNFEGLAKVGNNRYLIVSDDNENFFQKTLLFYFKID